MTSEFAAADALLDCSDRERKTINIIVFKKKTTDEKRKEKRTYCKIPKFRNNVKNGTARNIANSTECSL